MRIGAEVRRLSADDEVPPRRGFIECRGVISDPGARGRAQFESIAVHCRHRGHPVDAGECLRCDDFAALEPAGGLEVVVRCRLRPDLRIESLMTPSTSFAVVSPFTRVADAVGYANFLQLDKLLVATDDALVGLVCRCQLLDGSDIELVADRMATELWTVGLDDPLDSAAAALIEAGGGPLCVVEDDEVVGLLGRSDFARADIEIDLAVDPGRCLSCGRCPIDLQ